MRVMRFMMVSRPTKESAGVTQVFDEHYNEDGTTTMVLMGHIETLRGSGVLAAFAGTSAAAVLYGQLAVTHIGGFSTRSKAGHAIRAAFEADLRAAKKAAKQKAIMAEVLKDSAPAAESREEYEARQAYAFARASAEAEDGNREADRKRKDKRNARRRELRALKRNGKVAA